MEDKKVLEFINKHHEESYRDFIKTQKRKERKENILILIGILACLSLVLILGSVIHKETQEQVSKCVKSGNEINYCLKEVQ